MCKSTAFTAKPKTTTGLNVLAYILVKVYATGEKVAVGFEKTMRIRFDDLLPR